MENNATCASKADNISLIHQSFSTPLPGSSPERQQNHVWTWKHRGHPGVRADIFYHNPGTPTYGQPVTTILDIFANHVYIYHNPGLGVQSFKLKTKPHIKLMAELPERRARCLTLERNEKRAKLLDVMQAEVIITQATTFTQFLSLLALYHSNRVCRLLSGSRTCSYVNEFYRSSC